MLACDAYAGRFTMECVQLREVVKNDVSDLAAQEWRRFFSFVEKRIDFAEDPWRAMCRATNHHGAGVRELQHFFRFVCAVNISVRDHGHARCTRHFADCFVFGLTFVEVHARAAMYGDRTDAGECCNA